MGWEAALEPFQQRMWQGASIAAVVCVLALLAVILYGRQSARTGDRFSLLPSCWPDFLWLVLLLNIGLGLLFSLLFAERNTAAVFAWRFLVTEPAWDSWNPMIQAIEHLRTSPEVPLYSTLFFAEGVKFQYPVSSLIPFDLLQRATGASWETIGSFFNALSWLCVPLTGAAAGVLLAGSLRSEEGRPEQLKIILPSVALAATFYPLAKSYALGQIQTSMTLYAALALLFWQRKRPAAAGVCIGLCAAVKPHWWLFLLWALLRRQAGAALAFSASAVALVLASIGLYGSAPYFDYLPVLAFLSRHGEGYYPNQSVNGLLHRLRGNGNNLEWLPDRFPPFDPVVYTVTALVAMLIIGSALCWQRKTAAPCDLALLLVSLTIASPIAWEHHYGLLLPIFALITPVCLRSKPLGRLTGSSLLGAYVLTSQRFDLTDAFADTSFNFFQSYLFAGALLVLALLYRITSAPAAEPTSG